MSAQTENIESPAEHPTPTGGVLGEKVAYEDVFEGSRDVDGTRAHEFES